MKLPFHICSTSTSAYTCTYKIWMTRRKHEAMCMLLIVTCMNNEVAHVRLICKNSQEVLYRGIPQRFTNLNSGSTYR